jgi:hypothetical protein
MHMLDFVEAENSSGFHAPQEAERVLGPVAAEITPPSSPCNSAPRDPRGLRPGCGLAARLPHRHLVDCVRIDQQK